MKARFLYVTEFDGMVRAVFDFQGEALPVSKESISERIKVQRRTREDYNEEYLALKCLRAYWLARKRWRREGEERVQREDR